MTDDDRIANLEHPVKSLVPSGSFSEDILKLFPGGEVYSEDKNIFFDGLGVDSSRWSECDRRGVKNIVGSLDEYIEKLGEFFVTMVNTVKKTGYPLSRLDQSRYSRRGQKRIAKKIKDSLGHYYFKSSVMVTPTFDPKKIPVCDAWRCIGEEVRRLMNTLNAYRERHGFKRRLSYLVVLEIMANGYPHPHIVFPGLKYLVDHKILVRMWKYGTIDVEFLGGVGIASYACKYISKFGLNKVQMAMMRFFKLRLYHLSRHFKYQGVVKDPGWSIYMYEDQDGRLHPWVGSFESYLSIKREYSEMGYSMSGDSLKDYILKSDILFS